MVNLLLNLLKQAFHHAFIVFYFYACSMVLSVFCRISLYRINSGAKLRHIAFWTRHLAQNSGTCNILAKCVTGTTNHAAYNGSQPSLG
jgi:hypothetical protein